MNTLKSVGIEYNQSGLNSKRLILNAIIDVMESSDTRGIVQVSPEVHLEDVLDWVEQGLVYDIEAGVITKQDLLLHLS